MKTVSLTPFEMRLICDLFGIRDGTGYKISDLRIIQSIVTDIRKKIPEAPKSPEQIKPANGKEHTEEERKMIMENQSKYAEAVKQYNETEISMEMPDNYIGMIKAKLGSFPDFHAEEKFRTELLKLADKFGV